MSELTDREPFGQTPATLTAAGAKPWGPAPRGVRQPEAEAMEELERNIRDAVLCRLEEEARRPKVVRLHYVRDEVMAL